MWISFFEFTVCLTGNFRNRSRLRLPSSRCGELRTKFGYVGIQASSLGEPNIAIYSSDRPFKKETLLDFPVVAKAVGDVFMTEKMRKSSELIAHYNALFSVRRLFYKPEFKPLVEAVFKSIFRSGNT